MKPRNSWTLTLALILHFAALASAADTLFPTNLPSLQWAEFQADGFPEPVSGVIHRSGDGIRDGMPLGGVDTGCIDLEPTGLSSWCTIFNSHVPRRGPINYPFLGISTGDKAWILCVPKTRKWERVHAKYAPPPEPGFQMDWDAPKAVSTAREIHMWGHYPVADMEFETDAPVQIGLRAWSPFLPGDIENSVVPGAVFELRLRNTSDAPQKGAVAFGFRGPLVEEAGSRKFGSREITSSVRGMEITAPLASYLVGAIDEKDARVGGELMGKTTGPGSRRGFRLDTQATPAPASRSISISLRKHRERFALSSRGRPLPGTAVDTTGSRAVMSTRICTRDTTPRRSLPRSTSPNITNHFYNAYSRGKQRSMATRHSRAISVIPSSTRFT
jgi:hypothetical protein